MGKKARKRKLNNSGDTPNRDQSYKKACCPESAKDTMSGVALVTTQCNKNKDLLQVSLEKFEGNNNSIDEHIDKSTEEVGLIADVDKTSAHRNDMVGNKDGEMKCKEENKCIVEPLKEHAFSSIHETEHIDCFEGVICQKITTVEDEVSLEGEHAIGLNGNAISSDEKENNNMKIYVEALKNQRSISLRNEDYALEVMDEQIDNSTRLVDTEIFELDTLEVDQCVGTGDNNDTYEVILNDESVQGDVGDDVQCVRSTKPGKSITCDGSARCESVVVPELSEAEHCQHVGPSGQSEVSVSNYEVADVNDKVVDEASVEIMIEHVDEVDITDVGEVVVTDAPSPYSEYCSSDKHDVGKPNDMEGNSVLHTSHSSNVTISTVSKPASLDDSLPEILTAELQDDLEIKGNQDPNIDGHKNEQLDTRISELKVPSWSEAWQETAHF
ncbi:hypothetical protein DPMN_145399 [Dreissena polymorpha]|uniref:Uncharacterized protein n=1 Tax=Dreissena polymorpha TaxID=45954 RepID=A0A9D4F5Y2_DREPO|nr:hypothetical protein DPMN_145399 [Dreissena polymorpha]